MRRRAKAVTVAAALSALLAIVVSSSPAADALGGENCPNAAIRAAQFAQAVGQCRAFEQVSPVDKNNGDVSWNGPRAAVGGERIGYTTTASFAGAPSAPTQLFYASARHEDGWTTEPILPAAYGRSAVEEIIVRPAVLAYDEEVTRAAIRIGPPGTEGSPPFQNLFRWNAGGELDLLTPNAPAPPVIPILYKPTIGGAASDLSRLYLEAPNALTDEPSGFGRKIYSYSGPGTLELASLIPASPDLKCGGAGPTCIPAPSGAAVGFNAESYALNAVSENGEQLLFTAPPGEGQVYARKGGETTQVSAAVPGVDDPLGPKPAAFQIASVDGRYVFFTSSEKLTDDATTGPTDAGSDLYRYDTQSETLVDLIPLAAEANGARVLGVLGASDDGDRIYFAARGVLAPGGVAGSVNLYLLEGGPVSAGGTVRLVSSLQQDLTVGDLWLSGLSSASGRTSRVSSNGSYLAFATPQSLGGAQVHGSSAVYLFDAADDELECASCNAQLEATGASDLRVTQDGPYSRVNWLSRNLTDDGRLFFETNQGLDPADSNGLADVYAFADGQARLVSPGTGRYPMHFGDASPSGHDVFFVTRNRLVPSDTDEFLDFYDARVDGGFAEDAPLAALCSAEGCQGPATPAPTPIDVGSVAYQGPSNRAPKRAKKKHHRKSKAASKAGSKKRCGSSRAAKKRAKCGKAGRGKAGKRRASR